MKRVLIKGVNVYRDKNRNIDIQYAVNKILRGPKKTDMDMLAAAKKTAYEKWQYIYGEKLRLHWDKRFARLYVYNDKEPVGFFSVDADGHTLGHWYNWEDFIGQY